MSRISSKKRKIKIKIQHRRKKKLAKLRRAHSEAKGKEDKEKIRKHIDDLGGRFSFPTIIIDEENLITGHHEDRLRRALEI